MAVAQLGCYSPNKRVHGVKTDSDPLTTISTTVFSESLSIFRPCSLFLRNQAVHSLFTAWIQKYRKYQSQYNGKQRRGGRRLKKKKRICRNINVPGKSDEFFCPWFKVSNGKFLSKTVDQNHKPFRSSAWSVYKLCEETACLQIDFYQSNCAFTLTEF